ncbi:uncharacterized protein LOC126579014 [Anopheles aquasalis]|uniref:uncharacterized protein LOC126579014 n=1 Tax=Anopheles aquasalis TaxID=42839 RepID=UPI00215B1F8E|nr:uncharacterized protein LOC126579014 [Anopheles aquasalis]
MKLQAIVIVGLLAAVSIVAAKPALGNQCSKQEEGQTFGIASDCHKYTVCKKGELKVKSCESKYNYDVVTSQCVKINKATCATEPTIEDPQESDVQYDYLCTNVLFGLRIHPQDCDKYISCSGEKAKIEFCADGLIFRSEVIGCVAGDKISCEPLAEEPSTTTSVPDSGESNETGNGNASGESNEAGNGNASGESNETGANPEEPAGKYDYVCANVFLGSKPHPETCKKYISCYKSKAKEENCKKGYAYSSKLHLCVKQKDASCASNPEDPAPTVAPPTASTASSESGESTETGNGNNSGESNEAGNGSASEESTETGNGNNSGESNEAGNGNASGESNETGANPEEPAGKYDYVCANVFLGSKPHPETCKKYISCYKSKAKEENCKKGYAYSSKLHLCVKQKDASCASNPEDPAPTVAPPTASTASSESGESNETGNGNASGESTETGNGNNSGESNEAGNGNASGESNETGANPEEPAGKYDYVCANVFLGSKPHPETCKKYISCYKSKAKEENCKKGYAYSSKLHLCVKQKDASCASNPEDPAPTVAPPTASTASSESGESNETGNGNASGESTETGNGNNSGESNEAGNGNASGESNETGANPEEPAGKYDYVCANVFLGSKPHPETCKKYISCYKSKAKEENCKKGYAYSSKLHLCVKQKGDSCDSQGAGSEPTTVTTELVTEPETETQPQTDAPTTTETTTTEITTEVETESEPQPEPTTDAPTTTETTTTEITTEVETESEPQPEPTPPATGGDPGSPSCEGDFTGYLTIENDCVQYVYCYQGEPSVKTCLENYIYYAPFKACLPGDPVTCQLYTA